MTDETAETTINVYADTKDKLVREAHRMSCTQAELIGRAVGEYLERHPKRLDERIATAQLALARGKTATLAYISGVSEADIERIGGTRGSVRPPQNGDR